MSHATSHADPRRVPGGAGPRRGAAVRRGAVLVLVLIAFSGLSLLALGLCHRMRLELRMCQMRGDEMRAFYLALGGVNRAMLALRQDMADRQQDIVHSGQKWRVNATAAQEGFFAEMDDAWRDACTLSYATSDEEGRLSISKSSPAGWLRLPGMTRPILDSILDWEDEDDSPNPQGAESADYLRLARPHRSKNAPMITIMELGRVMGVDPRGLVGEDADGNGRLDPNEDDGSKTWPADNADGRLDRGFLDFFTVYGDAKVNLNTASAEVLAALQGIDRPEDIQPLLDYRCGPDRQPFTPDDQHFASSEDLARVPNLSQRVLEFLRDDGGKFTSQHFRVISCASVRKDGPGVRLWATISRTGGEPQLVFLTRF